MKTVEAKIPDRLDRALSSLVELGWFPSRDEIVQQAIRRFLEVHRPKQLEKFVCEDVEWGLRGRS